MNSNVTINHASINENFTLVTDARDVGIGTILLQKHEIIGLYSSKLNRSEANHIIMERSSL